MVQRVTECLTCDRHCVEMEEWSQFTQDHRDTPSLSIRTKSWKQGSQTDLVEVLHVVLSTGLQVDQQWSPATDPVNVLSSQSGNCLTDHIPSSVIDTAGIRPAMAKRWTMAFVLPPSACNIVMAFSKDSRVRI